MADQTWEKIVARIERIYATGRPKPEAISDLSDGEPTVFFGTDTYDDVSAWIRDTHQLALEQRRDSVITELRTTVEGWLNNDKPKSLLDATQGLSSRDFMVTEEIEIMQRDPQSS